MWELIFLMFVMKIPIVYLCLVVWWAVRAVPEPFEPAPALVVSEPHPWTPPALRAGSRRPRRGGPHGRPARGPREGRRTSALAEARR
jgi:hypothetical protein